MNDVSAVAGQLTILRERLEQKELELSLLSEQNDAERTLAISFINRLTQACRGHDRELDNKLARLRQRSRQELEALLQEKHVSLSATPVARSDAPSSSRRARMRAPSFAVMPLMSPSSIMLPNSLNLPGISTPK